MNIYEDNDEQAKDFNACLNECYLHQNVINPTFAALQTALHGNDYQLKLLMVFLLRGVNTKKQFKLSTEDTTFGKFDDIVNEQENHYLLVLTKHRLDSTEKIENAHLFSDDLNNDFSLCKYLKSFIKIKTKFNNSEEFKCIVCINIGFDSNVKVQKIKFSDNLNFFNFIKLGNKTPLFYQFELKDGNPLLDNLKNSRATELVEHMCSRFNERKFTFQTEIMKEFHVAIVKEGLLEVFEGSQFLLNWTYLQNNDAYKKYFEEYLQEVKN